MIKQDVRQNHLNQNPDERRIVEILLSDFEVNWARVRSAYNTRLSCYIIDPILRMREMFGFSSEIALFMSPHESIQPRTIQAINQFLYEEPIRGRVDKSVFVFIIRGSQTKDEFLRYYRQADTGIIPIILSELELIGNVKDKWGLRNAMAQQLFTQDLFDVQLPLNYDYGFFGRSSLVFDFSEAVSRGQNRGLFGLRKTGKTSLLFKIRRNLDHRSDTRTIYYDCKKPRLRKLSAEEFISLICNDVLISLGRNTNFSSNDTPYRRLEKIFESISDQKTICIIFDEIEYISYFSRTDSHWSVDFVDFWQTLWSIQSETGKLCYVITGVNAKIVEDDLIDGVQNPLFGIVPSVYLTGLEKTEIEGMIDFLGKRMGIVFSKDAIESLHATYGGHPLLTRKACSYINTYFINSRASRPLSVDSEFLRDHIHSIDDEIKFYFTHILSGIKEFYPNEFDILELIASGERLDAADLIRSGYEIDHLRKYGLISLSAAKAPSFTLDCLRQFVATESLRAEGRALPYREIPLERSLGWMKARLIALSKDASFLSGLVEAELGRPLFPGHSISKPEQFFTVEDVNSEAQLESFLVSFNQSLVEAIEKPSAPRDRSDFFFKTLKSKMPHFQRALLRIKVYRNFVCHSELDGRSLEALRSMSQTDFGTDEPPLTDVRSMRIMQQLIINELVLAIQEEIAERSP